ncbi:Mbov_0396 family ICE element transmembrane protein [Spiroplasma endosymbiont of Labia minor]|uniref:Mbov_0396 family ICE element transmembrane protein n=1 Tax=Spiroplasma endosymbiont of Labia minor TaxID=3066305 RepID=UPI0030D0768C
MGAIIGVFYDIIWGVLIKGPLLIISIADNIVKYLSSGITFDLLFGGKENVSIDHIPFQFWLFALLALFFGVLLFVINYLVLLFKDELAVKERIIKSLKSTVMAISFTFIIPFAFILGMYLVEFFQKGIDLALGGHSANLADTLYNLGNPNWDGTSDNIPSDYSAPGNIKDYNMFIQILGVAFMIYIIVMLLLGLVKMVCDLFFLFIISPLICVTMISDNGQRLKTWNDMVISKMAANLGALLGYGCFAIFIIKFNGVAQEKFNWAERTLLMLAFIAGGGMFALNAPQMMASFIGEAVGTNEGRAMLASFGHVKGMAFTGLGFMATALGLKKKAMGGGLANAKRGGMFSKFRGNSAGGQNQVYDDQIQPNSTPVTAPDKGLSESMARAKNARMRRTGIPGYIGKLTRAGVIGGHAVKSIFSKRSWSNAGTVIKNAASTAASVIVGNTAGIVKERKLRSDEMSKYTFTTHNENYKEKTNYLEKQIILNRNTGNTYKAIKLEQKLNKMNNIENNNYLKRDIKNQIISEKLTRKNNERIDKNHKKTKAK